MNRALHSQAGLPPRGYCREGHPIIGRTMLGHRGDLTAITLTSEQAEMLERHALEIFTIQSNAGATFAASLASILLTGVEWGRAALKEQDNG